MALTRVKRGVRGDRSFEALGGRDKGSPARSQPEDQGIDRRRIEAIACHAGPSVAFGKAPPAPPLGLAGGTHLLEVPVGRRQHILHVGWIEPSLLEASRHQLAWPRVAASQCAQLAVGHANVLRNAGELTGRTGGELRA